MRRNRTDIFETYKLCEKKTIKMYKKKHATWNIRLDQKKKNKNVQKQHGIHKNVRSKRHGIIEV